MLKSSYERALERFGGEPAAKLTDEQKARIADIERTCQSGIAEAKLMADGQLRKFAQEAEKVKAIQDDLVRQIATLKEQAERAKEKVRAGQS